MIKITEPAEYSYRNYPSGRYLVKPRVEVVESDVIIGEYRGLKVEFKQRRKASDNSLYRTHILKINGTKPSSLHWETPHGLNASGVRPYIDNLYHKMNILLSSDVNTCRDSKVFILRYEQYVNKEITLEDLSCSLMFNKVFTPPMRRDAFKLLNELGAPIDDLLYYIDCVDFNCFKSEDHV
jgi:hypothetical protein